jgi:alpha-mannosidase
MTRREFAAGFGSALAAGSDAPTLYYVDGYHGGIRGHMPAGSWRDILNVLRETPAWKLCLDIEPASWDQLRREDPQAYRELQGYLARQPVDARLEMVNGTFGQPFGWAVSGESNVRQLLRGREIVRAHFPNAALETYAVQEPCWASCLPQILLSLGFTGAVLKNPSTAWGGYTAGFDAEVLKWIGPDGSAIPTVPRYACEDLVKVWETESVSGTPEFSRKCVRNGIPHPSGMCFQDLGWAARPKVSGSHIRYVTWREYIHKVADKPAQEWRFSPEDILVALPWGEKTLQALAQQVRSAENRLPMAEKMAALAGVLKGLAFPSARFREAWDRLLWSQHHDAWITATTRGGRQAWAFQVAWETLDAEQDANAIIAASAEALAAGAAGPPAQPLGPQWVRVFSTLGTPRQDLAELPLATDRGATSVRVFDEKGEEAPCQVVRTRRYQTRKDEESLNAANVLFRPRVPALGYTSYRVEPVYGGQPRSGPGAAQARLEPDGALILENEFYRLRLDPNRGGAITSLFAKQLRKEFCDPAAERLFNEYRGYFVKEARWRSSAESAARLSIIENGPLRARASVAGQVAGNRFQTTVTLVEGQRRIDFSVRFTFDQDTWVGDPWDIAPENRRTERRRSHHDGRFKLQAFFPVALQNHAVYKNAAYDVCRSRNANTWFQGWHEIKHNIILNWADLLDEKAGHGLAVFSDHTTAYTHGPDHPLALVLGWGWEGGFWWGKCPLKGVQQASYAVIPHAGGGDEAGLGEEGCRWNEPPLTQLMSGPPRPGDFARSLVSISGRGVEIPTVVIDGHDLLVRLFNASGDEGERTLSLDARPARVEVVELDGRMVRRLEVRAAGQGRYAVRLAVPRFGIRTLRCYSVVPRG